MNYKKIYDALMEKAQNRQLPETEYVEVHHIKPTSLGGSNTIGNKVKLTYREHIVAHRLLYRMHPNSRKLAYAFHMMISGNRYEYQQNHRYSLSQLAEAKEALIRARTGTTHSEETKQKMRDAWKELKANGYEGHNKGITFSDETKEKMRQAKLGKKRSDEVKKRISETKKHQIAEKGHHRTGTKHSEETREKLRIARARRTEREREEKLMASVYEHITESHGVYTAHIGDRTYTFKNTIPEWAINKLKEQCSK